MNTDFITHSPDNFFCLDPADIEIGGLWLFWQEEPGRAFIENIGQVGQLEPVLVCPGPKGWELVSGYKRAVACRRLKRPLLARKIEADLVQRGLLYFSANSARMCGGGLSPEQTSNIQPMVRCLRYFQQLLPAGQLTAFLTEHLSPFFKPKHWSTLLAWLHLPRSWDACLERGQVSLETGYRLMELYGYAPCSSDLEALAGLFQMVHWSRNKQRQLIELLFEISKREQRRVKEIIEQIDLAQDRPDLAPKDRIALILSQLEQRRYPVLTEMQKRFKAINRKLKDITLSPRQHFEQNGLQLQANIASTDDLQSLLLQLQSLEKESDWQTLVAWMENGFEPA